MTAIDFASHLAELEPECTTQEALDLFDQLPAVRADDILGDWVGRELRTGHPMDGLLAASGWYGKRFDDVEHVHPLVFRRPNGTLWFGEPCTMPMGIAGRVDPKRIDTIRQMLAGLVPTLMKTNTHRARLRNVEYRGVTSAAMIYDHLPIIDLFRKVDEDTLLGVMDRRSMTQPYFFILARAQLAGS